MGTMKNTIFWDETTCFLVEIQRNVLPVFKVTHIFRVNPEDVGNKFFKNVDSNLHSNFKLHDTFLKMEAAGSTKILVT